MTEPEFDAYLADALRCLDVKQDYLENEFGLGRYDRFFVDYEKEILQFFSGEQVVLAFAITPVGSHVPEKDSWRWSWANASLPDYVRKKSETLQKLHEVTGFELFKQSCLSADESMAWEFVALSCKLLNSMGAYSMQQRQLRAYVLLDGVIESSS